MVEALVWTDRARALRAEGDLRQKSTNFLGSRPFHDETRYLASHTPLSAHFRGPHYLASNPEILRLERATHFYICYKLPVFLSEINTWVDECLEIRCGQREFFINIFPQRPFQ